jgi:GNAT superfamily N-acetyltransferase
MPAQSGDALAALAGVVSARWQAADPLLPDPPALQPGAGCGSMFIVAGPGGLPVAAGSCEHWHGAPDSLDLTWGAARRFQLTAQAGGPDVAAALDDLLGQWRAHLASQPGNDEPDSAAVVSWPSRDIDGVATLLRRGFAPRGVVAARPARRQFAGDRPAGTAGTGGAAAYVSVRAAGPADVDTVVRLGLAVVRFDAHFGGVVERPSTAAALRAEAAAMLALPAPWIWLAERGDVAIGLLMAEGPDATGWIAPLIGRTPVAYNMLTFVSPAERSAGVGAALTARFHAAAAAAGIPVTLLHYEQTNPLSAPFWGLQGYRPLWTSWESRPACTVR